MVKSDKEDGDIAKTAEKQKKKFAGCEISGKKLGIIGLGAIGQLVANAATHLGMEVYGYDPYISVDAAWNLSRDIHHIQNVEDIYRTCDYITIHVPLMDSTKGMINKAAIDEMKDGVVLLNYARDLLVDEDAVLEALKAGKMKKYVTDFANPKVVGAEEPSLLRILEHRPKNPKITVLSWRLKKSVISWRTETSKTPSTSRTVIWCMHRSRPCDHLP